MSGSSFVVFAAVLVAVFLVVVALLVWQEATSRTHDDGVVYVIDDAVDYVTSRLSEGCPLVRSDVRRILEWEIHYLQGLAQPDRRVAVETIAGGHDDAVDFIAAGIAAENRVTYDTADITEVLAHEAGYLVSIGAVGDIVGREERT